MYYIMCYIIHYITYYIEYAIYILYTIKLYDMLNNIHVIYHLEMVNLVLYNMLYILICSIMIYEIL